jgi:hypothetical protein
LTTTSTLPTGVAKLILTHPNKFLWQEHLHKPLSSFLFASIVTKKNYQHTSTFHSPRGIATQSQLGKQLCGWLPVNQSGRALCSSNLRVLEGGLSGVKCL